MGKKQKRMVDGKMQIFIYTPEMKQVIIDNCTKSHEEICEILKSQWPEWEYKPLSVKDIINKAGLNIPKKPAQKQVVNGKIEYFEFTPAMEKIVRRHYKTKSNREICEMLKAKWPQWEFKQVSIRSLTKRLKLRRTQEQMRAIIIRECASEVGQKRLKEGWSKITKHKIGDIYFCQQKISSYYGRLVIKVGRKCIRYYEAYIYEKHFGPITRDCQVVLIDPYGPIIPENLKLHKHGFSHLYNKSINLEDCFVIATLTQDKHTPEARQEFKNTPGIDILIEAKRAHIKLLRAIKEYENAGATTNSTDNQVEGTP